MSSQFVGIPGPPLSWLKESLLFHFHPLRVIGHDFVTPFFQEGFKFEDVNLVNEE
jgi:hypothetical protein